MFWENNFLVMQFWIKNGKCLKDSRMYSFEAKRNQNVKRRRTECSTELLSLICDIFLLWPLKLKILNL